MEMTKYEKEFLKIFKKKIFLSSYKIKTKVSIGDLCDERKDLNFVFGNDEYLVKNLLIDFVVYKGNKAVAGIEIIDEPEEFELNKGQKILIDTIFKRMEYKYFRIVDLTKLDEAAEIIKRKLNSTK